MGCRLRVCTAVAVALMVNGVTLFAQSETVPSPVAELTGADSALTPAKVTRLLQELEAQKTDEGAGGAAKNEALAQYRQALKWLTEAAEDEKKTAEFKTESDRVPERIRAATTRLAENLQPSSPQPDVATALEDIEQQLRHAEDALQQAQENLARKKELLQVTAQKRPDELLRLKSQERKELEQVSNDLESSAEPPEDSSSARQVARHAQQRKCKSRLDTLDAEQKWWESVANLLPLDRDLAKRDVATAEQLVDALRSEAAQVRARDAQRTTDAAQRLAAQVDPLLGPLSEQNVSLAARQQQLDERWKQVDVANAEVNAQLEKLAAKLSTLHENLQHSGLTAALGQQIRAFESQIPSGRPYQQSARRTAAETQRVQAELLDLENDRAGMKKLAREIERQISLVASPASGKDKADLLRAAARELLAQRRELLDRLWQDQGKCLNHLNELGDATGHLLAKIEESNSFIAEHMLWMRTAASLRLSDLSAAAQTVPTWWQADSWERVAADVAECISENRTLGGALLTAFGLALVGLLPLRRMRRRIEQQRHESEGGRYVAMLQLLVLNAVDAAYWPALLLTGAWYLTSNTELSDLSLDLLAAMRSIAPLLFVILYLRRACHERANLFNLKSHQLRRVRSFARLTLFALALLPLIRIARNFGDTLDGETIGRWLQIGAMLVLACALYVALWPRAKMKSPHLAMSRNAWGKWVGYAAYGLCLSLPLLIGLLLITGYVPLAERIIGCCQDTFWLALAMFAVYALLSRGAAIYRRHLEAIVNPDAALGDHDGQLCVVRSDAHSIQRRADATMLTKVVGRLQSTLRSAALFGVMVGSVSIWADVFPALRTVGKLPLGQVETGSLLRAVTVNDLVLCLLVLSGTILLARSLPDLVQVFVFRHLGFDRGAQFALTLMCRYGIMLVGVLVAARSVGITWSSVQWLVAAMTVGLGFGLQEIFANFVSGIIVLFERPIRLGDVITVNGSTGKVTRMQMRATTITDSDRRELIVPNKKFITDEIINWTLSDSTTRIVIPVKISNDSDPTQAAQVLIELANAHPLTLKDPEPTAVFKGFGINNLKLELRVFIGNGDLYFPVLHDLNVAIDHAFREAKIAIANCA